MRKPLILLCLLSLLLSCGTGRKEIGLQLYSIRGEVKKDLNNALKMTADAGYTFVEAAGYSDGKFYGKTPEEFTALCKQYGLKFTSSHINGPDPNVATPEKCEAWWKQAISAHKKAGVFSIVQPSLSGKAYASIEGIQKYCELFNQVGAWCKEEGIRFGYHNHSGEFKTQFDTPSGKIRLYDYMLQNTDPEKVFFQLDLYWIQRGGCSAIEYFEKYPGRFTEWHVKDKFVVGASGDIDFETIYQYAGQSGMKYQIVEQEAYEKGMTPAEGIRLSHDYLQDASFVKAKY